MPSRYASLWPVAGEGYEWARVFLNSTDGAGNRQESTDLLLTTKRGGVSPRWRGYNPLDHPALFREFAAISPGAEPPDHYRVDQWREAILRFSNKYGYLGTDQAKSGTIATGKSAAEVLQAANYDALGVLVVGEPFAEWLIGIDEMRRAVELWRAFENGDEQTTGHFIRWCPERPAPHSFAHTLAAGWYYDSTPDAEPSVWEAWILVGDGMAVHVPRLCEGIFPVGVQLGERDLMVATGCLVSGWINRHLVGHVAPRVCLDTDTSRWRIEEIPKNLLAALWLQFAISFVDEKDQRQCKVCGTWFDIPKKQDARHLRKEYCQDACKSKDRRRRKKQEQELAAARPAKRRTKTKTPKHRKG